MRRDLGSLLVPVGAAWPRRAGLAALAQMWLALAPAAAQTYTITTRAGIGTQGFSGDGGPATSAQLNQPLGVAVDGRGNVFIAEYYNHRIRQVSATGVMTTLGGTGPGGLYTGGSSGDGGAATSAQLRGPSGVAVDSSGNVFITNEGNQRIRRVSAATGGRPPAPSSPNLLAWPSTAAATFSLPTNRTSASAS